VTQELPGTNAFGIPRLHAVQERAEFVCSGQRSILMVHVIITLHDEPSEFSSEGALSEGRGKFVHVTSDGVRQVTHRDKLFLLCASRNKDLQAPFVLETESGLHTDSVQAPTLRLSPL